MKIKIFESWYLNMCATAVGLFAAWHFGLLNLIWDSDPTKLTSVIAVLWLFATVIIGKAELGSIEKDPFTERKWRVHRWSERKMKNIKFISETCATLGMIGTVIGFILMTGNSGLTEAGSAVDIKNSVSAMLSGFGVAMFTTLVGAAAKLSIDSQIVSRS